MHFLAPHACSMLIRPCNSMACPIRGGRLYNEWQQKNKVDRQLIGGDENESFTGVKRKRGKYGQHGGGTIGLGFD